MHVHVIPRRAGDFGRNDQVYEQLDANGVSRPPMIVDDAQRVARSLDQMAEEADAFRALFLASEQFDPLAFETKPHDDDDQQIRSV